MKTKTRLTAWLGILTLLVLVLGGVSLGTIWNLGSEGKDVLKANYNSIEYSQHMLEALDLEGDTAKRSHVLMEQLANQQANITEVGEGELTKQLARAIGTFRSSPGDLANSRELRKHLNGVIDLNRSAIIRKAADGEHRADKAFVWISIAGTLCFLIAFTLFLSLPERIAEPIRVLTEGIDRIAAGQYSERVELQSGGEFGHMADRFNAMADELERWENSNLARVMEEKARAEAVINSLRDASIGLDDQGRILFMNRQALELCGLQEQDLLGQHATDVAARNDLLRHLLSDKASTPFKVVVDGRDQFYAAESTPINGSNGVLGTVHTVRNITPFQERDQAKTMFLATISHELKTPLASTDIGLSLLERRPAESPEQAAIVADLRKDHQRLVRIVSELLDMAQVESGQLKLETAPHPLAPSVEEACSAVHGIAASKGIAVLNELPHGLPNALIDPERTAWVMVNLLGNAIRHAPMGSNVEVKGTADETSILLVVSDTGPGIPPEFRDHLFQPFGEGAAGTGLGLSIARRMMEAMGGSITAEAGIPGGTVIQLRFRKA
jgi:PAS domain S-box-containing protein